MGNKFKDEANDTLFRTHDHGRVQIWALDHPYTDQTGDISTFMDVVDGMLAQQVKYNDREVEKVFHKMIFNDYKSLLTPKQIEYVETADVEGKYRRNDKYYYRNTIQNTIMMHYFGEPIKYKRCLNQYLAVIKYARDLLSVREDAWEFTKMVDKLSDTFYMEDLVHGQLDTKMSKEVIASYRTKNTLSKFTINTICEIAEDDIIENTKKIYE